MAIPTAMAAKEAVKERLNPAIETLDDAMRRGRRTLVRGQHAVEDAAAATALEIRRRPLSAVGIVAAIGALGGGIVGFALGRTRRRR